uniref:MutL C-terminal dimerisation domain-containing protein n=2 Tax=Rhizophora mucronata TaxID=61149 RepID=A0A2P2LHF7_RHIMU
MEMESINPLPEAVRSSIRSGIILFDLTRVVEELVFNSLDAAATKVSVYVGLGSCCVKVVDNGSGISRDGLVLLGERHVTSKHHHLADIDTPKECFGFRGEALASISDVSLLEIVTKAHGMPNGYRKIVKGSKCLYLGIDDSRKDFGTTVVVRDLFYNQPVRRKYMQSSPKKVLHSVKKCIFRIALVHSKVSFKVADIDSEDELLSTCTSSTLLLLKSGFGIENTSCLHELNASDGVLKLSGYILGPCDGFEIKAFQYVCILLYIGLSNVLSFLCCASYICRKNSVRCFGLTFTMADINSRFVSNSPIHKLLNHLAVRFECPDPRKAFGMCQKVKRSRPQVYPSYIVNLSCSSAFYDLAFEPSKTFVEFKDWFPILSFIEKAIPNLQGDNITPGEFSGHTTDIFLEDDKRKEVDGIASAKEGNSEFAKKYDKQNHQPSCHLASPPVTKNSNSIFNWEHDEALLKEFCIDVSEVKEQQADMESAGQSGYCLESLNDSPSKHFPRMMQKGDPHLLISDDKIVLADDHCVDDRFTTRERSMDNVEDHILNLEWPKGSPNIVSGARNIRRFSLASDEMNDELELCRRNDNSFVESCSSRANLAFDGALFASDEAFESSMYGLKTKRRRVCVHENAEFLKSSSTSKNFDIFPSTLIQDEVLCAPWFPLHTMGVDVPSDFDFLSESPTKSFSSHGEPFVEKKDLASDSIVHVGALFQDRAWDVEHIPLEDAHKWSSGSGKRATYGHFRESKKNKSECAYGIMSKSSSQENCISGCRNTVLNSRDDCHFGKGMYRCLQVHNLHDELSVQQPDVSFVENKADGTFLNSFSEEQKHNKKNESQGNQLGYQNTKQDHVHEDRYRRSHSAPPFYKYKRRFISLHQHSAMNEGKPQSKFFQWGFNSPEADDLKLHFQPNDTENLVFSSRLVFRTYSKKPVIGITPDVSDVQIDEKFEVKQCTQACNSPDEGFMPNEIDKSSKTRTKWRRGCQQMTNNSTSCNIDIQHDILDVSSGFLHLAGNSLVPECIHRNCLEDAKVLHQVDKKFIPIVAGGTLAVIDQHAADERIQLEELRQKVLSGQAKTVTYLDSEEELMLPEIGHQLLLSYAEQIREWGWICNIQAQGSATFTKNLGVLHHQLATISLTGVIHCHLSARLSV